jgi:hypothetical protein
VCLSILREGFDYIRIGFVAVRLQGVEDHAEAAVGHDCAFERRIGLQPDNYFVLAIDIAGRVGGD